MNGFACSRCVHRNSWDCDDGWYRVKHCKEFKLDWETLTEKQKKAIRHICENMNED